jgi:hypothetical protein
MLRAVALRADNFYAQAENLGKKAAVSLERKKRAQISGLEGIANSALKTTDVFDFIKLRTARQKEWKDWGPGLLEYLSHDLYDWRKDICNELGKDSQSVDGLYVHLLLIREFVHQLAAHYEYACEFPQAGGGE